MDNLNTNIIKDFFNTIKDINIFEDKINYNYLDEKITRLPDERKSALLLTTMITDYLSLRNQYIIISDNELGEIFNLTKQILKGDKTFFLNKVTFGLKNILKSNTDFQLILDNKEIPCYQYSPTKQLEILGIDPQRIVSPVLDIGCGQGGHLVKFLRTIGIDTRGFDRIVEDYDFIARGDWLHFDYGFDKWGTIISHLGFSNHFTRYNMKKGDEHLRYAEVYMKILNSLKNGGTFFYAPGLEFIEKILPSDKFVIDSHIIIDSDYQKSTAVKITRK